MKALLPVVALSDDRALENVNIPWLFRFPAGTAPSDALDRILAAAELTGPNRNRLREALAAQAK